ncbi:LytR/AlgR family response regulator transcription factor [Butyrivibrio sp. VCD2006]|uniref:LytR/AlgR family response regulator transcription factor n=1 Tax=Butyrivibrio sp. VCD2006 TaxID=1280664 RepID=UPI00042A6CAE|nr:LytTR family DNA-binding domain-containing protein [Butyrivibrio sp. VCD2006]
MKLAIVDDESVFRQETDKAITTLYGRGEVSCFHYADGKELISGLRTGFMPDAVFLDIEMKEMNGMETARAIRSFSADVPIIFLTSHTEMAMDGYEVGAFRFLKKPMDHEKLREALRDLENKLKVEEKIALRVDGEDVIYPISSLIYAEASNNSVRFVFTDGDLTTRMKLNDAIKLIDGLSADFFKCHRSYHINLAHVYKLGTGEVSMDNGDIVPISRGLASGVKKKLFDYIRRTGR